MSTPSDDDFDDDALQESIGRSLGGISPGARMPPGLAQALLGGRDDAPPSQGCVDIYGFPGANILNPFGHIGFSKDGGPIYGKTPQPGYDGRSLAETVPGTLEQVVPGRKPSDHVQICGAPGRIETAYRYWTDPKNSRSYSLVGDNCSTLIPDGLRWSGLPIPMGGMTHPRNLMEALHSMYDSSGQTHFEGTRP